MGTWNYRIVKQTGIIADRTWVHYYIKEVYYNKKGKINGWTEKFAYPGGQTPEEVIGDLELMKEAFNKPVLEEVGDKLVEIKENELK